MSGEEGAGGVGGRELSTLGEILKYILFKIEHFICQHLIPLYLCLLMPFFCFCAYFCLNADPTCETGSSEVPSLKSTALWRIFQTKYINWIGKFLSEQLTVDREII